MITPKIGNGCIHAHSRQRCAYDPWLDLLDNVIIPLPKVNDAYNSLDISLEEMMAEDDVIEYLYLDK